MIKTDNNIKSEIARFIKKYKVKEIDYEFICDVIKSQGFDIIEYNKKVYSRDVEVIVNNLGLIKYIQSLDAFTYADGNFRIVFINTELSDDEKLVVAAHEEGHIFCDHLNRNFMVGKTVCDEYEANEFAHYLLNPSLKIRTGRFIKFHKKLIAFILAAILIMSCTGVFIHLRAAPVVTQFYVTQSGKKYHKKECMSVKHNNTLRPLTQEEFDEHKYEPCKICLPDMK